MKSIWIILVCFLVFSSCSEDDDRIEITSGIIGKWTWVESTGGIAGVTHTPESTGNEICIEFTDVVFKKYVNNQLEEELSYEIVRGSSIFKEGETDLILYENDTKQSVENRGDFLFLNDECVDCFRNKYVRKE